MISRQRFLQSIIPSHILAHNIAALKQLSVKPVCAFVCKILRNNCKKSDTPTYFLAFTSLRHFIFVRMGYESVSALIVLIIIVALMFGWLPKRTVNSMKSMLEHSEDRYSPSLHIVDYRSESLFHACSGTMVKGVGMQPSKMQANAKPNNGKARSNGAKANNRKGAAQSNGTFNGIFTPEHVARIRALRRAAIRRRRILVLSLAVLTLVVFAAGLVGIYSAWFAVIPFAALCTVLYFGSMAAKHARLWEAKVAVYRKHSSAFKDSVVDPIFDATVNSVVENAENAEDVCANPGSNPDNTETSVMQQRDISMALSEANRKDVANIAASGNSNQDLISFSFGSDYRDSNANSKNADPQSLEIKSTKQVAKAIPANDSGKVAEVSDVSKVSEVSKVVVEPPVSTKDSLGKADLRDVLARRAA